MTSPFRSSTIGGGSEPMLLDTTNEAKIVAELDAACLRDGLLQPMPAAYYAAVPRHDLSLWCVRRGFYCLPTLELIEWLRREAAPISRAIEIGAGNGVLGRALVIPRTDSRMQERPEIAEHYAFQNQAVVTYGPDVEKLSALQAAEKYRPRVVVASWVTHKYDRAHRGRGGNMFGVDEGRLLDKKCVEKYVFIGHERVHAPKPILSRRHETHRLPFLFSRSLDCRDVIWIWRRRR